MKIKKIELDQEELPAQIVVKMSIREAAFIAQAVGAMNDIEANKVFAEASDCVHSIYNGLIGGVFNRFWEDGLRDAVKEM